MLGLEALEIGVAVAGHNSVPNAMSAKPEDSC